MLPVEEWESLKSASCIDIPVVWIVFWPFQEEQGGKWPAQCWEPYSMELSMKALYIMAHENRSPMENPRRHIAFDVLAWWYYAPMKYYGRLRDQEVPGTAPLPVTIQRSELDSLSIGLWGEIVESMWLSGVERPFPITWFVAYPVHVWQRFSSG